MEPPRAHLGYSCPMETRIELAPNCWVTAAGAKLLFAAPCLFSLAFSMIFAAMGFWPVLPFWALEMLALGLAVRASLQRRAWTQTVTITDSQVSLVTRSRRGEAKQEFARHWAKVRLRSPRRRLYPSRLLIESRGRAYEVGSFLTEEDRCQLAERLRHLAEVRSDCAPLEI